MMPTIEKDVRVGHLCCGSGFGAKGWLNGNARVGNMVAKFRNIGGVDVDPAAIRDFERFARVKGTVLDLMDLDQYVAFHGRQPPVGWRAAVPADIRAAMGHERPHIWFVSAPCKGFSGLLSQQASLSAKYQALNGLTLRAVWLALEAYKDDPAEFILFENVPRIANRGRALLNAIQALFAAYGYAFAETTHDCGELGGLAQSRKRFLMVARHREKVPPFLYEPPKRRLRGVGEVLSALPLPGDERAGPMHRMPSLQWKTWVRLAFVEAGSDWRSLNKLKIDNGMLADFRIRPEGCHPLPAADLDVGDVAWQRGVLGVRPWDETSGTVTGRRAPTTWTFAVADPRAPEGAGEYGQYGVRMWGQTTGAVINVKSPGQGGFAIADPRTGYGPNSHRNKFAIVPWRASAGTITGSSQMQGGALSVADPRSATGFAGQGKYRVTAFDEAAGSVIGARTTGQGAFAVADPRPRALNRPDRDGYQTQGHYGVVPWDRHSGAIPAYAKNCNGSWSVADPRGAVIGDGATCTLPASDDKLIAVIRALDGTWHRPFTTLELAALQSLFDPADWFSFEMDGTSDSAWRERIGNAVPSNAAAAIAGVMGRTLLLAWCGESFMLSSDPIWVKSPNEALAERLQVALAVDAPDMRGAV